MKYTKLLFLLLFIIPLMIVFPVVTFAQGAAPVAGPLDGILESLTGKFGWLTFVIVWVGVLRTVFKPLMTLVDTFVANSPGTRDDKYWQRAKTSSVMKWMYWAIDYVASIKLGTQRKT